jgi:hypothetical protein
MLRPKDRRPFKNDGRSSGKKWIHHEEGLAVNFRPKANSRRKSTPVIFRARVEDKAGGVECLVCGVTLSQLGSHISRVHGISGIEYRERFGEDAPLIDAEHLAIYTKNCQERGQAKHASNFRTCPECGTPFRRGQKTSKSYSPEIDRDARRIYCSDACTATARSRTAKQRTDRLINLTHSRARIAYITKARDDKQARCTVTCVICKTPFFAPSLAHGKEQRSKFVGLCSTACRAKYLTGRKREARP